MMRVNPRVDIYLDKIFHNAKVIVKSAAKHNIEITGVTKVYTGLPQIVAAEVKGGIARIADSRLENLRQIKEAGFAKDTLLLRLPAISQAEETVCYADISLNSEEDTVKALSHEAVVQNKVHKIIIMVEMGDLREGVLPEDVPQTVEKLITMPNIEIVGIGANFSCYGGVVPTPDKLSRIVELAGEIRNKFGLELPIVHGGNSSALKFLFEGQVPQGITNLSIGEGIVLGRETIDRQPIEGTYQDTFVLSAEIIELKVKDSVPNGVISQDAFGNIPVFEDRGRIKRAILAIGRQDVDIENIIPMESGVDILGASSDHLLLDVTKSNRDLKVGDEIHFTLGYGALLKLMTSKYVYKNFIE